MIQALFKNKIVLGILVLLVGAGGWYALSGDSSPPPILETQEFAATNEAEKDLVATLLQLRAVSLSGTLFSDPAFQSLKDFGSQVLPEPVGRLNPFAPIEFMSGVFKAASSPSAAPPGFPKR